MNLCEKHLRRSGAPDLPLSVRGIRQDGVVDEALALRLRTAFNARDIDALRSLLAEGATWGEDPEGESFCHDRNDVIRHVKELLDQGVQATIVETTTGLRGIAVRLHVDWLTAKDQGPELQTVHQAYMVTDGLITEIHGHDDEESALAAIAN